METAKRTIISGLLLVFESFGKRLIGLASTLILARVLMPEDFGLVAIAMIYIGLVDMLANTGTEPYVLRHPEATDEVLNTAWTLNLLFKSGVSAISLLCSPLVASYYGDNNLLPVLLVLSLLPIAGALPNPGVFLLKREQNYAPIVRCSIVGKSISVVATVAIALIYQSYWALVLGHFFSSLSYVVGTYVIHRYRPSFSLTEVRQQFSFSVWMLPQALFGYSRGQLDSFLVSSAFGPAQLGSYHTMKYLSNMPVSELLAPITQPLLVEIAKVLSDKRELARQYSITLFITACLIFPVIFFMFNNAEICTLFLLGENWVEHSQLFGILAMLATAFLFGNQASRLQVASANTKLVFYYDLISFVLLYGMLFWVWAGDVIEFTLLRVAGEIVLSVTWFCLVTTYWLGVRFLLRTLLLIVPILVSSYASSLLASMAAAYVVSLPIVAELMVAGLTFLAAYLVVMLLLYACLYRYTSEGQKVFAMAQHMLGKVLKRKPAIEQM